jgi:hypothetical protein
MKSAAVRRKGKYLVLSAVAAAPIAVSPASSVMAQSYTGENANTNAARADAERARMREEQRRQQELDAAYRATTSKQKPAAQVSSDPWADVRGSGTSTGKSAQH